ncbi:hypothetical protein REPUB_Repub01dG0185700 [Reevesia pubescens]
MAFLNRLPTKDRLQRWALKVNGYCILCNSAHESRNHLFFERGFFKGVWGVILQFCQISRRIGNWSEEVNWALRKLKGKSLLTVIIKIV